MSVGSCRVNKSPKQAYFTQSLYIIYTILLFTIFMQYTKDDEIEKLKNLNPNQ